MAIKLALALAVNFFALFSFQSAHAVSLPECIGDSVNAAQIIESAPCGFYGIVHSRQENGVGNQLDVTVQYMVHLPMGAPKAMVLLFSGGAGGTGIEPDGQGGVADANNNFLVRSAQLFAEQGYFTVTIDRPSTTVGFTSAQYDVYRTTARHAQDIAAVVKQVQADYQLGSLDLFLAGTSRGALSIVAQNMLGIGSLLSSPVTSPSGGGQNLWVGANAPHPRLKPDFLKVPAHLLFHVDDGCSVSKPVDSQLLLNDLINAGVPTEFDALVGGFVVSLDPCDATTYHGFLGIENSAVQQITSRMDFILAKKQLAFPGNLKPSANNGQYVTKAGAAILINLATLTDDPNNDFLHYGLTHSTSSRGGALWRFGRFVIYAPPVGATNVTDGFVYVVSDGKGEKDIGIVSIRVN